MAHLLASILKDKGTEVTVVAPGTKVADCIKQMCEQNIGSLVVVDNDQIVGLFTERETVRRVYPLLNQIDLATATVADYMSPDFLTVTVQTSVEEAMTMFTNKRTRHLPVVDEAGKLAGIISIGDVTKWIIDSQQDEIDHLSGYIHS